MLRYTTARAHEIKKIYLLWTCVRESLTKCNFRSQRTNKKCQEYEFTIITYMRKQSQVGVRTGKHHRYWNHKPADIGIVR